MEDTQEYDFLNFAKDLNIRSTIARDEPIFFTDKIIKINRFGFNQERNIMITDKAIYNLKKKQLKRRIKLTVIRGITIAKQSDEFVIHCMDDDYDYQYSSPKRKTIVEIIAKYFYIEANSELKLFALDTKALNNFVTTKKDKEKDKNSSCMPHTGLISVSEYIYGTKSNVVIQKKEALVVKTGKIFTSAQVAMTDFEIIKTIGRGSVGKIILARYKKTGDLYAIKNMRKDQLISENIIDNVLTEKNILAEGQCEFMLTLSLFFQSTDRIYLVTPFLIGGDLYHKLKNEGCLSEEVVRFYTAQVAIAIEHLHAYGIAYRDLKPENILIDEDGYLKLCDFGASLHFQGNQKENTFAGSPEYVAPEIINHQGHTIMCDWWSFGILLYELLYGITPFFNSDKKRMFELIVEAELKFPKTIRLEKPDEESEKQPEIRKLNVSQEAQDLIKKLLEKDPDKRLGANGLKDIYTHPFFATMNFDKLKTKKLKAPYKPQVDPNDLTSNFEEEYLNMDTAESPVDDWINDYQDWFNEFEKHEDDADVE